MTVNDVKSHSKKRMGEPFASTSHYDDKYNYAPILMHGWNDDCKGKYPVLDSHPDVPVVYMTRAEYERNRLNHNRYLHMLDLLELHAEQKLTVRKQTKLYMAIRIILNDLIERNSSNINEPLNYQGLTLEVA